MAVKKVVSSVKTILVPTDFSDKANKAIDFATLIASKTKAKIVLLHVVELPYGTNLQIDKIRREYEKGAKPALKQSVDRAKTNLGACVQ